MVYKKSGNKITRGGKHNREDKHKKRNVKTKKRSYRKYKGGDTCEKINDTCICKDNNNRVIHKWKRHFDDNAKSNYWFDELNDKATWIPPC